MADYYMIYILQKQGEVADDKGKVREALAAYEALLGKVKDDPNQKDVVTHLQLGIGNCLLLLEEYGKAQDYFQKIAEDGKDETVLAGAFNGLGRCHIEKQEWKAAVLCFLRTWILYDEDPRQTAQALYYSGHVFSKMAGAGIGEESSRRAKAQFKECMRLFPGSSWAKRSESELAHVR
jgi:tetratricopeptide (TPR) repeat protein